MEGTGMLVWAWPKLMQTPKRDFVYMNRVNITNQNSFCYVISLRATLNEISTAKNNDILPRTP